MTLPTLKVVDSEYRDLYESINEQDKFWGDIADMFYWKKRWNTLTRNDFDCKKGLKGPISIGNDIFFLALERRRNASREWLGSL